MLRIIDPLFHLPIVCISALIFAIALPAYANVTANRENGAVILSQAVENEIIDITGVTVNPTEKGLEIILETKQGENLKVLPTNKGNSFIADVPNSQLRLPKGETFTQNKVINGITSITVKNLDAKTIQVTVVGKSGIPNVELFDGEEGLIFDIIPATTATQAPSKK
jgi:iron complex outermembrane receptor protein